MFPHYQVQYETKKSRDRLHDTEINFEDIVQCAISFPVGAINCGQTMRVFAQFCR